MKLYNRKHRRYVERQVHFGLGRSVKTACGKRLPSRRFMVELGSNSDGAMITNELARVTCKRCLATNRAKLQRKIEIERQLPGIFDIEVICGEQWLLEHALIISNEDIDSQKLEINVDNNTITLSNKVKPKDRKGIIREVLI